MRDGYVLGCIVCVVAIALGIEETPVDPTAFYYGRLPEPYTQAVYSLMQPGFFYSPAVAQLLEPFRLLPLAVFGALWVGGLMALLYAMLGRRAILGLMFVPVGWEVFTGNIHLVFAAVAILGLRYPALWAIPLLTKVTPGIGLLWFLVRREWWSLAIALGLTGAIALASFLIAPDLWGRWIGILIANRGATDAWPAIPVPLLYRLPAAAALIVWGARTDRRWTVLVGAMISSPVMWWTSLSMLVGLVPLLRAQRRERGLVPVMAPEGRAPMPEPPELVPVMDPLAIGAEAPAPPVPA
jgi:hypothetical protein